MNYTVYKEKNFSYIDEGKGQTLVLLHGLFGALSNWHSVIEHYKTQYRIVIPMLPVYTAPLLKTSVSGIVKYVANFLKYKSDIQNPILIGNSLGGHVALIYALQYPKNYKAMVLTGSSGLYENAFGGSFPRRGDYEYIKNKTQLTFFNPENATKELIDEVFEIINDREKLIKVLAMSKSAIRNNLAKELPKIQKPTLLIWGAQDTVTPPSVAQDFHKLINGSELHFINECGHAPMMEQSQKFNELLDTFLEKNA